MIECHRRKNNQDKKDFQKMRTNYDKSKFYLFLVQTQNMKIKEKNSKSAKHKL